MRLIVACLVVLLPVLCACSRSSDEERIRQAMAAMQQAMQERSPRAFMAHVGDDFVGNEAVFDKTALFNLLRVEVLRNDSVGVMLGPIDIELQGDRATAHVVATVTGGSGGLLPEHGAVYDITSGWKRQGREWVCISGRWEQKL